MSVEEDAESTSEAEEIPTHSKLSGSQICTEEGYSSSTLTFPREGDYPLYIGSVWSLPPSLHSLVERQIFTLPSCANDLVEGIQLELR